MDLDSVLFHVVFCSAYLQHCIFIYGVVTDVVDPWFIFGPVAKIVSTIILLFNIGTTITTITITKAVLLLIVDSAQSFRFFQESVRGDKFLKGSQSS